MNVTLVWMAATAMWLYASILLVASAVVAKLDLRGMVQTVQVRSPQDLGFM